MPGGYRRPGAAGHTLLADPGVTMAQVTVFVDDAVRGTLPGICAKDGIPTADRIVVRDELGDRAGLGVAWLLLLAGPLGWLGLILISVARSGRREVLTVRLPLCEAAYQRMRGARRLRRWAVVVGVLGGVLALVAMTAPADSPGDAAPLRVIGLLAGLAVIGAIVALFLADRRLRGSTVGIDLDASRRWVTITAVHPAFAAACQAQEQQQPSRT